MPRLIPSRAERQLGLGCTPQVSIAKRRKSVGSNRQLRTFADVQESVLIGRIKTPRIIVLDHQGVHPRASSAAEKEPLASPRVFVLKQTNTR